MDFGVGILTTCGVLEKLLNTLNLSFIYKIGDNRSYLVRLCENEIIQSFGKQLIWCLKYCKHSNVHCVIVNKRAISMQILGGQW